MLVNCWVERFIPMSRISVLGATALFIFLGMATTAALAGNI
jgi:hypothetical protein